MSIDKNTNEGKNYRNNVVKSTPGTSKSRINTGFPENISVLSPMMQEYCKTKETYKDCILFYRLGDFYEMFFDDALLVSKELELTLTGKDCGLEERAPMCGIPFHAAETYIKRLIERGHKVAICEQVEDPKKAKGLVKREVIRVVTPGTTLDATSLDESKNNYLMSIVSMEDHFGCAIADITTGDCFLTEVDKPQKLLDEINKFVPAEIICNDAFFMSGIDTDDLKDRLRICIFPLDNWYFDDSLCQRTLKEHFHVNTLEGLGIQDYDSGVIAAGALFQYLNETQKTALSHMASIRPYSADKFMLIDSSSRRNLELVETLREKQKRGSLLWVLDKTRTAMGARTLRGYVEQPLIDAAEIRERLTAVEELTQKPMLRDEIREYLNPIYDLERLISRISYQSANPRDMVAFASSLAMIPFIRQILGEFKAPILQKIYEDMDPLEDVTDLIRRAIVDEPPLAQKDGGIIREGYHADVDKYRRSRTDGKKWLAELEAREKERTGIKSLKIKYSRVFGYSLEVTNSFKDQVPDNYVRKQTLTNAERYITQELKELEDLILGAEDRLYALEYELFADVRDKVGQEVLRIQKTAKAVAALDVFASLALVAEKNNFVRLGGVLGYTEFVGKKTFWWKILELTSLVNSFSFARDYPFHSWTIGNNVSFKKSVLEEIGMFEENFPFKLGGDDLDMTYRVTKAGYMIGSAPNAVTYHSRETWNNFKAIHNRAMRWGTMERLICNRHKELYKRVIPKNYILILLAFVVSLIVGVVSKNWVPSISVGLLAVWDMVWSYIKRVKTKGFCNPIHFLCAMGIQGMYEYYRIKQSLKEKSLGAFYCGQVFNRFQIKYGMKDDSKRIWDLLLSYTVIFMIVNIICFVIERV